MGNAPERRAPFTVIMIIGLMLALITCKIVALINKYDSDSARESPVLKRKSEFIRGGRHRADHRTDG
jgi:hypothetical protein